MKSCRQADDDKKGPLLCSSRVGYVRVHRDGPFKRLANVRAASWPGSAAVHQVVGVGGSGSGVCFFLAGPALARPWREASKEAEVRKGTAICGPVVAMTPCIGRSWPGRSLAGLALGCTGLCLKKCAWLCQLVATAGGRQRQCSIFSGVGLFLSTGDGILRVRTRQGSRVWLAGARDTKEIMEFK